MSMREALVSNGTDGTTRIAAGAQQRPQLDERLVEVAGSWTVGELRRRGPDLFVRRASGDVALHRVESPQDSGDISVHRRDRAVEGDRGHGPRGVSPEAGKRSQRWTLQLVLLLGKKIY